MFQSGKLEVWIRMHQSFLLLLFVFHVWLNGLAFDSHQCGRPTAVDESTKKMWRTITRSGWRSKRRVLSIKQVCDVWQKHFLLISPSDGKEPQTGYIFWILWSACNSFINNPSLLGSSAAAFQQGKIPPSPFPGAPPPGGSLLPHPNISESPSACSAFLQHCYLSRDGYVFASVCVQDVWMETR